MVRLSTRNHERSVRDRAALVADDEGRMGVAAATDRFGLTPRESDVAFWLSHGKTNAEIGMILGMSCRTAEKHVQAVLFKLKAENRTTAAVMLCRWP